MSMARSGGINGGEKEKPRPDTHTMGPGPVCRCLDEATGRLSDRGLMVQLSCVADTCNAVATPVFRERKRKAERSGDQIQGAALFKRRGRCLSNTRTGVHSSWLNSASSTDPYFCLCLGLEQLLPHFLSGIWEVGMGGNHETDHLYHLWRA